MPAVIVGAVLLAFVGGLAGYRVGTPRDVESGLLCIPAGRSLSMALVGGLVGALAGAAVALTESGGAGHPPDGEIRLVYRELHAAEGVEWRVLWGARPWPKPAFRRNLAQSGHWRSAILREKCLGRVPFAVNSTRDALRLVQS